MNKERRKSIEKAVELLAEAKEIIEIAAEEEQEYADNMPENMCGSEKHEKAEEISSQLTDCSCDIENIISSLSETIEA